MPAAGVLQQGIARLVSDAGGLPSLHRARFGAVGFSRDVFQSRLTEPPDTGVFKRWLAFGLLSSHSRLHGSQSYRVPWAFDAEAVEVTGRFMRLKLSLMPYLARVAEEVTAEGVPMLRPMVLEFPADRGGFGVDTQYLLGDALLVAPVFRADGVGETYLPAGRWTHLLDASVFDGPGWDSRTYGFDSLGVFVRPGTVLPIGAVTDTPEYAWAEGVTLRLFELPDGFDAVTRVPGGTGAPASFRVRRTGSQILISSDDATAGWSAEVAGGARVTASGAGEVSLRLDA